MRSVLLCGASIAVGAGGGGHGGSGGKEEAESAVKPSQDEEHGEPVKTKAFHHEPPSMRQTMTAFASPSSSLPRARPSSAMHMPAPATSLPCCSKPLIFGFGGAAMSSSAPLVLPPPLVRSARRRVGVSTAWRALSACTTCADVEDEASVVGVVNLTMALSLRNT